MAEIMSKKDINKKLLEEIELYKTILDITYNWIVAVDTNGIIIMINKPYCNFLEVPQEQAIGSHVTEVIPNTRMHIV